jgi:hypothetical protein
MEPGLSLLGLSLGALEDVVLNHLGPPIGRLEILPDETWMIYGPGTAVLLVNQRLAGVRFQNPRHHQAVKEDATAWDLPWGLEPGQLMNDVRNRVPYPLVHSSRYELRLSLRGIRICLLFSPDPAYPQDPEKHALSGLVMVTEQEHADPEKP